uniref:Hydroxyproline-rich glycoprotein family protein n=1 Tax=Davidia involucrata TaxID=16924 RepID=A0A5B6YSX4_DAVIN
MRRVNGEIRGVNNTLETINAAATAIASAENRVPQATLQKRRWGGCWRIYWCFGYHKHNKRIGHAVLLPETTDPGAEVPAAENPIQAPAIALPFVAPPPSPASFLQSEPPSATQSPAGLLSLTSMSASMYSPGGPASIFAIGPYAHETQLVSPPVFSTITTEPSTAPFTPPPESVQLTTPSSPEVPFARLLDPNHQNGEAGQRYPLSHYEFQSYQLYPGSPVGHLISPSSGFSGSGTSSPFPDSEFAPGGPHFLEFRTGIRPKLLNLDKLPSQEWGSRQGSGSLTPDAVGPRSRDSFLPNHQNFDVAPLTNSFNRWRNDETVIDHRVSFEITAEEVVRCVEKKPTALVKAVSASIENAECAAERDENSSEIPSVYDCPAGETSNDTPEKDSADGEDGQRHQSHQSLTLRSVKEFNFDNADGGNSEKPTIGSDWWANEKVLGKEVAPTKNWTFFPMMQPGVS